MLAHPVEIARIVGCRPQFGAVGQHAHDFRQIFRADEAAAMMARLGPRIGEEHEQPPEHGRRQRRDHGARIVGVDSNVVEAERLDTGQQLGNAVQERLATDDADIRVGGGLGGQMLAAAEADFEPERPLRRGEQAVRVEPPARGRQRQAQARQQVRQPAPLGRPERPAQPASVQDAPGRGAAGFRVLAQAKADRMSLTRSSRSQENPPSASGLRPKWP